MLLHATRDFIGHENTHVAYHTFLNRSCTHYPMYDIKLAASLAVAEIQAMLLKTRQGMSGEPAVVSSMYCISLVPRPKTGLGTRLVLYRLILLASIITKTRKR